MRTRNHAAPGGFTIVELLTVIAVIVLILSMIVPGINYTKKVAKELRVRAQIKGLGEGIEAFYGIYDYYPPSNRSRKTDSSTKYTCGAEKMAEALVGLDLQGYDPQSTFDVETSITSPRVYAVAGIDGATAADAKASLDRRKEMFVTPTHDMVAVDVNSANPDGLYANWKDLYATAKGPKSGRLLCDAMKVKDLPGTTMTAGTPFLYYRANTDTKVFDKTKESGNIYNYEDNKDLLALGRVSEEGYHEWYRNPGTGSPATPPAAGDLARFYDAITNPAVTTYARPYNANTFIIISAGYDGIFGTKDDITNFKR
jgi:type II secretory pathway pseudopilin PulG